jgi:CRISPR-associated protein Cas2
MAENKLWYLVCYDIRDPKRWRKAFKLLKGYGSGLQYSIFRCRLEARQIERLRWELETILNEEDRLMIIALCGGCISRLVSRNTKVQWQEAEPRFQIM